MANKKTVAQLDQDVERLTGEVSGLRAALQPLLTLLAAKHEAGEQAADAIEGRKADAPESRLKPVDADDGDDADEGDEPTIETDVCPSCGTEVAYSSGVKVLTCPNKKCRTVLEVGEPDDDGDDQTDDEAEDDEPAHKARRNPGIGSFFFAGRKR